MATVVSTKIVFVALKTVNMTPPLKIILLFYKHKIKNKKTNSYIFIL
jgi:hypothetical protein